MKKKYKYLMRSVFLALIAPSAISAQSFSQNVIGSAGTYATSASVSMAWTIGEVMVNTYTSSGNIFTQGFQQPDSATMMTTGIVNAAAANISVYPNPVVDNLVIAISGTEGTYSIEVYDLQGKLLKKETVESSLDRKIEISFTELGSGMYLVNIVNSKTNLKNSYKITKLN